VFKRIMTFNFIQLLSGFLIAYYLLLVKHTTRWNIENQPSFKRLKEGDKGAIILTWHSRIMLLPGAWTTKELNIKILISTSRDGSIVSNACRFLKINTIRVTNKVKKQEQKVKKPHNSKPQHEIIKSLRSKDIVVITPDGPRGPRQRIKKGALRIARITGVPIYPIIFSVNKRKVFKTWDNFILPFPFNTGKVIWTDPIYIPKESTDSELKDIQIKIENIMNNHLELADLSYLNYSEEKT
jgi:lysophospholipid acyltransferase (LPLAT)-like uncharacterized protein